MEFRSSRRFSNLHSAPPAAEVVALAAVEQLHSWSGGRASQRMPEQPA
jgi:hypothetical protein